MCVCYGVLEWCTDSSTARSGWDLVLKLTLILKIDTYLMIHSLIGLNIDQLLCILLHIRTFYLGGGYFPLPKKLLGEHARPLSLSTNSTHCTVPHPSKFTTCSNIPTTGFCVNIK